MKSRFLLHSLLLCMAIVMAMSPGFAAAPGADARQVRFAQMIKEGWQQVAPGVLQRSQGSRIETFTMGPEGFSWLAEKLQDRHELLQAEYRLHPAPGLMKEIQALAQQIGKVQEYSGTSSSGIVIVPVCATSYTAQATANPMTTAPGARADASATFTSDCGSSGDTYAYAYARGTLNGTTTTVTQTDPDTGSSVSGSATASAAGNSDCYSYATSRVISFDEGISYSVAAENFDCQTIKINDVSVNEGNTGTTSATFTVTLSSPSSGNVTVTAQTADGTATAPSDYTAKTAVLTFTSGQTSQTFTVLVNGDTTYELNETFTVNLSASSGPTIVDAQGVGTILENDPVPSISINDVSQNEGNSGTSSMPFTVTLSNPSSFPVTVTCQTANGTATAPSDYLAATTPLTFSPGQISQTCPVTINGDTSQEANETFTVNLSGASGGTIFDAQGVGTILNDDNPTIVVTDMTVDEASVAEPQMTLTLSIPSIDTVTVNIATADGLALSTVDYVAVSQLVTFLPGETSKTIPLPLRRDNLPELSETYFVNFTNPVKANLSKTKATITINDDDAVAWSLSGDASTTAIPGCVTLSQVGWGRGAAYNFKTFPLSNKFDMRFRVGFGIYDAGGGGMVFTLAKEGSAGLGGNDMGYQGVSPSVGVEMDTVPNYALDPPEDHMAMDENGSTPLHAGYSPVQASAISANIEDGFEHTFRVTRDPLTQRLDAYFDGSLRLSYFKDIANTIYGGTANSHFGMTAGSNCNDSTCPNNVLYFCPVSICIGDTATPQVQIDDIQVSEGNTGNQTATFQVNLYCPRNEVVTVNYATANGTATAGLDYLATAGTLVFNPGETQKTVAVTVYPDPTSEPDETFTLNLSSPSVNLATPDTQAVATIIDDVRFTFGQAGDVPLWGDWNGDGIDTPGFWRNGTVYLRNSNTPGPADVQFTFGDTGDQFVVGDWTGSGIDRVGVFNGSFFYLKTANTTAASTLNVFFGQVGDRPIAGDWNGDGIDTVGVQRGSTFLLSNSSFGSIDVSFSYGLATDVGITGDWNGDGIDTIGVFRNGIFYLRNSNTTGVADVTINYGALSDLPLAGDLDGDGDDAVGYFRNGTFVLRK